MTWKRLDLETKSKEEQSQAEHNWLIPFKWSYPLMRNEFFSEGERSDELFKNSSVFIARPLFSKVSPSAVPVAELVTINVSYVAMQNGKLRRIRSLVKNLVEFLKKYSKLYKGANLEAALYK